jgi:hypothetical protein
MKTPRSGALMCAFFFASVMSILAQGNLTPPGPPAATMKTLQQIEPRTDLQATPAPPGVDTTNANYQFIINQPGSYYLSANLGVTKANGIQINAAGVALDLNGFEISRTSGTGGNGIEIPSASHRARIRNGSIRGFAFGISSNSGSRGCIFRDLVVTGSTNTAISASNGALESCAVHDNSGSAGISAGNSSLTNCTATNNSVTYGISANNCSLTNCVACSNSGATNLTAGFFASNSTLTHCVAAGNRTTAGTSNSATGMGFYVQQSTVQDCIATDNRGDGIRVLGDSLVHNNACSSNGSGGDGAGINVVDSRNRIENNNATANDRGIEANSAGNVIVRNTAGQNTTNYSIVAGNHYGPIIDNTDETAVNAPAATGNSATGDFNTTHPWANIAY